VNYFYSACREKIVFSHRDRVKIIAVSLHHVWETGLRLQRSE